MFSINSRFVESLDDEAEEDETEEEAKKRKQYGLLKVREKDLNMEGVIFV